MGEQRNTLCCLWHKHLLFTAALLSSHYRAAENHVCKYIFFCLLVPALTCCSLVDEDLSNCGAQAELNYELRLVTNMTTEITTELTTQTDLIIANALQAHLADVFTDYAHDVDLSFYDTRGDSLRLQHDEHIMNANQASYNIFLPMRQYMHLATANILDNELVTLERDDHCHRAMLYQTDGDTIASHTTGVFTARQPMEVLEGVNQQFNVHLYMANCAAALIIDPQGHDTTGIEVYSKGFATAFNICDSTYVFPWKLPIIRTMPIHSHTNAAIAFCSVTFPSPEPDLTRLVIETEEPFIAQPDEASLWEFRVYVPQPGTDASPADGSFTENILHIKEPLRAGQLKIIKVRLGDNGVIVSDAPEVGVSVTLDWKQGNIYNPTI